MSGHNIALPRHRYVWVRSEFVSGETRPEMIRAAWVGLSSTPGRMLGCHVVLDSGALILDLPLHALSASDKPTATVTPRQAQGWDCFGWQMEVVAYPFLDDVACRTIRDQYRGRYWFSVDWLGDGYSMEPEQHKQLHVIATDIGPIIARPQDDVLFHDASFTDGDESIVPTIRRQRTIWRAEYGPQASIAVQADPETYLNPMELPTVVADVSFKKGSGLHGPT